MNFFKKYSILAFLFLASLLNAQKQRVIPYIPSQEFLGVHAVPGHGYFTIYYMESGDYGTAYYIYEFMDLDMKTKNREVLTVPYGARFKAQAAGGQSVLLVFNKPETETDVLYVMSNEGKLVNTATLSGNVKDKVYPSNNHMLYPAPDNGFYMVQNVAMHDTAAVIITKLDPKANLTWEKYQPCAKGHSINFSNGLACKDYLVLLGSEYPNNNRKAENKLFGYSATDGSEIFRTSLFDGENTGYPDFMKCNNAGNLVTGGMYFKGKVYDGNNFDGMFFLETDKTGAKLKYEKVTWAALKLSIKGSNDNSDYIFTGKSQLLIHDLIPTANGYKIICEVFFKSNGTTVADFVLNGGGDNKNAITIRDFLIYDLDANGKLTKSYRIEKKSRNIAVPSGEGYEGLQLAKMLARYGMFSYRYVEKSGGADQLVFVNFDNEKITVYSTPLEDVEGRKVIQAEGFVSIDKTEDEKKAEKPKTGYEKFEDKMNAMDKAITKTDQTFNYSAMGNRMIQSSPGHFLIYTYDPAKKELALNVNELK